MTDAERWRALIDQAKELQRQHEDALRLVLGAFTACVAGKGLGPSLSQIDDCEILQQRINSIRAEADAIVVSNMGAWPL